MKIIDLHVHSTLSDGTLTPEELAALAAESGLCAFALTDHDTTEGLDRAIRAAEKYSVEMIPGIEFSTRFLNRDIHILGYFMDYHAPSFRQRLCSFADDRTLRNERMCARIREYAGFPITPQALKERWPNAVVTRAHMAAWLTELGYVPDPNTAFDKYLGDHAPCFIPKVEVLPVHAVRLLLEHGGVPVLAHPLLYSLSKDQLNLLLEELTQAGLLGIEALYPLNRSRDEAYLCSLAAKYGLLVTGGSDFHGANKPHISLGTGIRGNLQIPAHILDALKAARP